MSLDSTDKKNALAELMLKKDLTVEEQKIIGYSYANFFNALSEYELGTLIVYLKLVYKKNFGKEKK